MDTLHTNSPNLESESRFFGQALKRRSAFSQEGSANRTSADLTAGGPSAQGASATPNVLKECKLKATRTKEVRPKFIRKRRVARVYCFQTGKRVSAELSRMQVAASSLPLSSTLSALLELIAEALVSSDFSSLNGHGK